jgi:hypothetical protein
MGEALWGYTRPLKRLFCDSYCDSKLAMILLAMEINRRAEMVGNRGSTLLTHATVPSKGLLKRVV